MWESTIYDGLTVTMRAQSSQSLCLTPFLYSPNVKNYTTTKIKSGKGISMYKYIKNNRIG